MCTSFVIITPAKNEGQHIERLIRSVVAQTILPSKWVIVSDGSTDNTDSIAMKYQHKYPFIELVKREAARDRHFGSKAKAISFGLSRLNGVDYQFIGNLDADASLDAKYYENVLEFFRQNPRLGIAAGATVDMINGVQHKTLSSKDSVGGIAQFFRRECWEQIGGYLPLRIGGIDSAAEIMARMNGWEVRQIPGLQVFHHRKMGTGMWGNWERRFFQGRHFYLLGHHPLFFSFKCIYRCMERPFVVGSILLFLGYAWAFFSKEKPLLPKNVVGFLRSEQKDKLSRFFKYYQIINLSKAAFNKQ